MSKPTSFTIDREEAGALIDWLPSLVEEGPWIPQRERGALIRLRERLVEEYR